MSDKNPYLSNRTFFCLCKEREIIKRAMIFILIIMCMGCGLSNVVNRGEYIEQNSVQQDVPRKDLLARFGGPIDSRMDENGSKVEVFRCKQGEKTSGKIIKGFGILALDVLTLGLTEAVFTPATDGQNYVTFEVKYDDQDKVKEYRIISN
ncbi:MAG: hypothetical protein JRD69_06050 [Deltaproteobacteria bacterium]|nr:hypothetical protein [Deltaproteobacteria bacterium]